jgi:hypothetical protein
VKFVKADEITTGHIVLIGERPYEVIERASGENVVALKLEFGDRRTIEVAMSSRQFLTLNPDEAADVLMNTAPPTLTDPVTGKLKEKPTGWVSPAPSAKLPRLQGPEEMTRNDDIVDPGGPLLWDSRETHNR